MKRCFGSQALRAFFPIFKPNHPIAMATLSSLFLPNPHRPLRRSPSATPLLLPLRPLNFSTRATSTEPPPPPLPEKKSFAVATGELFLGLASKLIIRRGDYLNGEGGAEGNNGSGPRVTILPGSDRAESWWRRRSKEDVASVVEDPVQPEVVWEQRKKDVEAERGRKAVTSPGFSFSAAGLLFPYHLGVAQLLLEKGYIKVCGFESISRLSFQSIIQVGNCKNRFFS